MLEPLPATPEEALEACTAEPIELGIGEGYKANAPLAGIVLADYFGADQWFQFIQKLTPVLQGLQTVGQAVEPVILSQFINGILGSIAAPPTPAK